MVTNDITERIYHKFFVSRLRRVIHHFFVLNTKKFEYAHRKKTEARADHIFQSKSKIRSDLTRFVNVRSNRTISALHLYRSIIKLDGIVGFNKNVIYETEHGVLDRQCGAPPYQKQV